MINVYTSEAKPIKSWCEGIEETALKQAKNLANHPCTFKHVAVMPDCHPGYGMPIGGVVAFENAVCPNAVGADIGCGMVAVRTGYHAKNLTPEIILEILLQVKRDVPVGFDHHKEDVIWDGFDYAPDIPIIQQELNSARRQLGTLGGGNHFIEIQAAGDQRVWLMIHAGSRNFGFKIAKEYIRKAEKLCEMWHSELPPGEGEDNLAFLPIGSREAKDYITAMISALAFAERNRVIIMGAFKNAVSSKLGPLMGREWEKPINIHHNFAAMENHFGKNVWVHRKGATSAREGQLGIIPGSMGTPSYIVRGKGNPESFMSCSHGAGRVGGRKEFTRTHTVEECDADMKGIVFLGWSKDRKGNPDLSEAPKAYKDIESVIEAQADLVEIVAKLHPLGVLKA